MNNSLKAVAMALALLLPALGCTQNNLNPPVEAHDGPEPIARTEFTDRVENFFEYEPLHAGKASQFRIHLTDLSDGSPVEKAQVSLTVRQPGEKANVVETI